MENNGFKQCMIMRRGRMVTFVEIVVSFYETNSCCRFVHYFWLLRFVRYPHCCVQLQYIRTFNVHICLVYYDVGCDARVSSACVSLFNSFRRVFTRPSRTNTHYVTYYDYFWWINIYYIAINILPHSLLYAFIILFTLYILPYK